MKRALRFAVLAGLLSSCAWAQSLGDVARQQRDRMRQDSHGPRRVYTNEDIATNRPSSDQPSAPKEAPAQTEAPRVGPGSNDARQLQAEIRTKKLKARELETRIAAINKRLAERLSYGPTPTGQSVFGAGMRVLGPCELSDLTYTRPYKDWCAEPAKLNAELEQKNAELKQVQDELEKLQERARRMGFGSAFYDPE